jgi:hypothetical protein
MIIPKEKLAKSGYINQVMEYKSLINILYS